MLNKVFLHGRIVNDLDLKHTPNGAAVVSFSVAVDRDFKDSNGERTTDFLDIVAWRNTAEFICRYFAKGQPILVEGSLQVRNWTSKDGQKRRSVEVIASNAWFTAAKKNDEPQQRTSPDAWQRAGSTQAAQYPVPEGPANRSQAAQATQGYPDYVALANDDSELPF